MCAGSSDGMSAWAITPEGTLASVSAAASSSNVHATREPASLLVVPLEADGAAVALGVGGGADARGGRAEVRDDALGAGAAADAFSDEGVEFTHAAHATTARLNRRAAATRTRCIARS
jgi:hypothetical protein